MTTKDKYRICSEQYPDIPLFLRPWWMDAVCGRESWDVRLAFDKIDQFLGLWVFSLKSRWGLKYIVPPPATPYTGLWLNYDPAMSSYHRNRLERNVIPELLEQLPRFHWMDQRFHYQMSNWLPLSWNGFSQTTRYTYLLRDISDDGKIDGAICTHHNRKIKRALSNRVIIVTGPQHFERFYELYQLSAERKGLQVHSQDNFLRLHTTIQQQGAGEVMLAIDAENKAHAGAYLLWDAHSAYYWIGCSHPKLRDSGAPALLLREAILYCSQFAPCFDFDGSMHRGIERFFSGFGAAQTPCLAVAKGCNLLLETMLFIRSRWNRGH
jgi:hypothetical protein